MPTAFLYPEVMREYTLTFGDTLFPDDIDARIQTLGALLLAMFAMQILGMVCGMVVLSPRVVAHANLILVNVLLFVLAVTGASVFGPQAVKYGPFYALLAIVPGPMIALHTMWGTYSVRYKSVFALKMYKWMSFFCLAVLGTICFSAYTYANTEFQYLSGENADSRASDADIEALVVQVYKAADKCPPFRLTCRNAIAYSAYNLCLLCGMYSFVHACLLALCCFAAWHLHLEKSLVEELLEELKQHPSHKDVDAFILAKQLVEHGEVDAMAYADEDGDAEALRQQRFAKQRLASMFKGYRVKSAGGTVLTIRSPTGPPPAAAGVSASGVELVEVQSK